MPCNETPTNKGPIMNSQNIIETLQSPELAYKTAAVIIAGAAVVYVGTVIEDKIKFRQYKKLRATMAV